jgi:hypothetical protein
VIIACIHTPRHEPPAEGALTRGSVRRESWAPDGTLCVWEDERLEFAGRMLVSHEEPQGDAWCAVSEEAAWAVDELGQDGPYVSLVLRDLVARTARCVTLDVRTGQPITLAEYDERHAERRWERAQRAAKGLDPGAFLVGDRHIRFCRIERDEVILVPVK